MSGSVCPRCPDSGGSKGLRHVLSLLNDLGVSYRREVSFPDLRRKNPLRFDIYIEEIKLLIEYDGGQHFYEVEIWGGEEGFEERQLHDIMKDGYCISSGYSLWRIPYTQVVTTEDILLVLEKALTRQVYISYIEYVEVTKQCADLSRVDLTIAKH
jgi:very-short-patch-repair endonuclease